MKKTLLALAFALSSLMAIDFNTASKAELMKVKGIGPKKAEAIIQYRKTHKIKSINDLKNIKGFNSKTISKIKNQKSALKDKANAKKAALKNKKSKMKAKMNSKKEALKNKKEKLNAKKSQLKKMKKEKMQKLNSKKSAFKNKVKF